MPSSTASRQTLTTHYTPLREAGMGVVAEVGEGVSWVKEGDRVTAVPWTYAEAGMGTWQEYTLVKAEHLVTPYPGAVPYSVLPSHIAGSVSRLNMARTSHVKQSCPAAQTLPKVHLATQRFVPCSC